MMNSSNYPHVKSIFISIIVLLILRKILKFTISNSQSVLNLTFSVEGELLSYLQFHLQKHQVSKGNTLK